MKIEWIMYIIGIITGAAFTLGAGMVWVNRLLDRIEKKYKIKF